MLPPLANGPSQHAKPRLRTSSQNLYAATLLLFGRDLQLLRHCVAICLPLLHLLGSSCLAGVANLMYAHQTYVPAPVQQSAPILSVDRMSTTAQNLEQTVPLLHEAHTVQDILVGAYQTVQHQVALSHLFRKLPDRG